MVWKKMQWRKLSVWGYFPQRQFADSGREGWEVETVNNIPDISVKWVDPSSSSEPTTQRWSPPCHVDLETRRSGEQPRRALHINLQSSWCLKLAGVHPELVTPSMPSKSKNKSSLEGGRQHNPRPMILGLF